MLPNVRKLNNYNYEKDYDNIIEYLTNSTLPTKLSTQQQKRFIEKYKPFHLPANNKLMYEKLEVIKKEDITKTLQPMYIPNIGQGQNHFYAIVQNKYLNITKQDVINFLRKQVTYQLTFKPKITQQPVKKYTKPNVAWAMDLIDISRYSTHNRNYKFILSVIDVFSQQIYLRKLKNKEAHAINSVLKPIFETQSPKNLLLDNGGEFRGLNDALFKKHNIKILNTPSHTPQPNIEQINGNIRRILSHIFVEYKTLNWVDFIHDIETNINNYNALPRNIAKRQENIDNLENNIIKPKYRMGDFVRIKQTVFSSHARQENKAGFMKYQNVKYGIYKYKIARIYKSNKANGLPFYGLADMENQVVYTDDMKKIRRFREIDLQKVPENSIGEVISFEQNQKLNQTKKKNEI